MLIAALIAPPHALGADTSRATRAKPAADAGTPVALKAIFTRPKVKQEQLSDAQQARITLGQRLFHDKRLSANGRVSCASCHSPSHAFADPRGASVGVAGLVLPRNAPSLLDIRHAQRLFWDGRAATLEEQALVPLEHPKEMGLSLPSAVARLQSDQGYRDAFQRSFPDDPEIVADGLLRALAAYERSLNSPVTRFDRWVSGDARALSAREQRGFRLFAGKARCLTCHGGWRFTDDRYHDIGLPSPDLGRGQIDGGNAVPHSFRTPGLRQLRWTAPYMHDGSLTTLADVISHYIERKTKRPALAAVLRDDLRLSASEQTELLAFLLTLSTDRSPHR